MLSLTWVASEEFVAHTSAVNCLKIGRKTSRVLVTGGEDHKVNLWAIGKPNALLVMPLAWLTTSPFPFLLIYSSTLQSLSGHTSGIDSVSFDSSEVLVAAGAASGTIKLWDLEEAKSMITFPCLLYMFSLLASPLMFSFVAFVTCSCSHPYWSQIQLYIC